ncbi:Hypothetical protein, putative [Bodo saltans]|uniref:Uncharacterized protein n=1 Tax=Bodo saltans TaxID=75058 RepID=A0A0S4JFY4_BODSA|nr:Hypothetical protein, putative [Bodo saltans]|eukprot:CUG87896.1 Hypothetical protein, putative [Bodo saltans]
MDTSENIPCSIDGSAFGRVAGADVTNLKGKHTAVIAKPHIRDRGNDWLSAADEVDGFELPKHRVSTSTSRFVNVRYVADGYDEQWVEKMNATRRKAIAVKVQFSVPLVENIFTALEVQAASKPSITFHRLHLDAKQLEELCAAGAPSAVGEQVTEYWKSKRRANGGLPLIASLATIDDARMCTDDVLGDCPLPFMPREGDMYATLQVPDAPWRKRHRLEESTVRLQESSRTLAATILLREEAQYDHLKLTLFELATLRADAWQA